MIVTDLSAVEFRNDWGLKDTVKVLSNAKTHTLNSGPNAAHVYDSTGTEIDSVSYTKSTFFTDKGQAGWVDSAHLGAKTDTTGWTKATVGDAEGRGPARPARSARRARRPTARARRVPSGCCPTS